MLLKEVLGDFQHSVKYNSKKQNMISNKVKQLSIISQFSPNYSSNKNIIEDLKLYGVDKFKNIIE